MPPRRTNMPVVLARTERTREENQERAYLAASRRSDRSLEARVGSAQKASELHKKRTGRSLRVTKQDVLNEEMYEEGGDDDTPAQYQYMLAHIQAGTPIFIHKFAVYLRNNVAIRDILESSIRQSYQLQQLEPTQPYDKNQSTMSSQAQQQRMFLKQLADSMLPNEAQNVPQKPQQAIRGPAHWPTSRPFGQNEFRPTPELQSTTITTSNGLDSRMENSDLMTYGNRIVKQSMPASSRVELPLHDAGQAQNTPRSLAASIAERRSLPTPSFAHYPQNQLFLKPEYSMSGIGYMSGPECAPAYNHSAILAWTSNINESKLDNPQMENYMERSNPTPANTRNLPFPKNPSNNERGFDREQSFSGPSLSYSRGDTTSSAPTNTKSPAEKTSGWAAFMKDEILTPGVY